ncbi:Alpha/Beta hydrolase protein, partial [Hyaloraphidium curvatum]
MDVLAGRPSATLRRVALLAFLGWAAAALRRDAPPAVLRGADARLRALGWPPWKLLLALFAAWQAIDGAFLLLFLNPPEPARGLYKPAYFRAVQILTAMDAGFWTVMNIGPAPLRHVLSILASVYFLLRPRLAEDTVRRFRSQATVRHLRLGWNKAQVNPILRAVRWITADKIAVVREVFLPRPQPASPSAFEGTPPPIRTLLFFNGTDAELAKADAMVLHLPGGGFVSMPPEVHSDYLRLWAKVTGLPVLSIDYGKAPEFPYPWALEECFDAYRTLVESNGAAIGMCGWYAEVNGVRRRRKPIRIAVTGDSAGGNLAVSMTYRILEHPTHHLPAPSGLLLTYPNLTFDMAAWMPSDEVELLRKESRMGLARATSSSSVGRKKAPMPSSRSAADLRALETTTPLAAAPCPAPAGQEDREGFLWRVWDRLTGFRAAPSARKKAAPASHKNISMTSRFAYSADPMLPPETVRSLALLYIGNSPQQPDFGSDYFLNPVVAPDDLLARFPKIYLVCGEKDPLVDDTVIFAGRVREAKSRAHREWLRLREELRRNKDAPAPGQHWNPSDLPSHPFAREPADMVHTRIIEGISHGFLNYMALFPEARDVAL